MGGHCKAWQHLCELHKGKPREFYEKIEIQQIIPMFLMNSYGLLAQKCKFSKVNVGKFKNLLLNMPLLSKLTHQYHD